MDSRTSRALCARGSPVYIDRRGYLHTSCKTCRRRRQKESRKKRGKRRNPYTTAYRTLRRAFLVGKRCEDCGTTDLLTVDHIVELSQGGALLDTRNWRALCDGCHQRRTRRMHIVRRYGGRVALGAVVRGGEGMDDSGCSAMSSGYALPVMLLQGGGGRWVDWCGLVVWRLWRSLP